MKLKHKDKDVIRKALNSHLFTIFAILFSIINFNI